MEASVFYNYTQKNKNQGAAFEKKKWQKVAHDDNDNNNRCETTVHTLFHTPFHKLQCKRDDRQPHTY